MASFAAGDFVCPYGGKLLSAKEAEERERTYKEDASYIFHFVHDGKKMR